jgi:hypothetical protein
MMKVDRHGIVGLIRRPLRAKARDAEKHEQKQSQSKANAGERHRRSLIEICEQESRWRRGRR